jgi:hypothetical protein
MVNGECPAFVGVVSAVTNKSTSDLVKNKTMHAKAIV